MHVQSFRVFCDLAETESFTKAAQINGITQSAVSQQVSSLERQLKTLLIERSKKRFRLTHEGKMLYESGKQIVQGFDGLVGRLQEARNAVAGSVRAATIYSLGLYNLPPYLKKFLRAYPQVSVQIEYQRASQVYEDVLGNAVDVGMVAYPWKEPRLEIIPLAEETLVLACPPGHELARNGGVKLSQLKGQRYVGFEHDVPTRKAIDRILRDAGVEVQVVREFDNIETVKRAVEIEAGVAIVPQNSIAAEVAKQTLVAVPFTAPLPGRPLAVIHRRSKVLSPAVRRFIEILKEPV